MPHNSKPTAVTIDGRMQPAPPEQAADLVKNSAFSTMAGLLVSLTGLISTLLIARVLGVEGAGVVAFAVWIAHTGASFADVGMSMCLMRYVPELHARGQEMLAEPLAAAMFRIVALVLAISVIALTALSYGLPGSLDGTAWSLVGVLMVVQTLSALYIAYLKGRQQFDRTAALAWKSSLCQISVLIVGLASFGTNVALVAYVAGALLPFLLSLRLLAAPAYIPADLRRRVLVFASVNWVTTVIGGLIWRRAEILFLQMFWGFASVGLFSAGLALSSVATLLPALLLGALLPHFSSQIGRERMDEMHATYAAVTRLMGTLVFPICFGVAAICPVLVPMLYGAQFAAAIPSAMILAVGAAIGIAAATNTNVLFGLERVHILLSANVLGLLLMILFGLTVVPRFGVEGAALTRVVVQGAVVAIECWYVVHRLGFKSPMGALLKAAIAASLCGAAAFAIVMFVGGPASLLLAVPTGALIYFGLLRKFRVLEAEDRRLLMNAALRIPAAVRAPVLFLISIVAPLGEAAARRA